MCKQGLNLLLHPQVTIEVVDNPQMEMEMDLAEESRNDWSQSSEDWLSHKNLFWPLFWEYQDPVEDSQGQGSLEDSGEDYSFDVDWRWKGWYSRDNYGEYRGGVRNMLNGLQ